jgi:hypothetical protein
MCEILSFDVLLLNLIAVNFFSDAAYQKFKYKLRVAGICVFT